MQKKKFGQKKGSIIAAENKRQERINRTEVIKNQAKKQIGILNKVVY